MPFVESHRDSLIPSDSDQLIPSVPFSSLLSVKASQQQSPTSAANENEICERLKAIDFVKDDTNGNVTVTKSASSNNDFIVVDVVVSSQLRMDCAEALLLWSLWVGFVSKK